MFSKKIIISASSLFIVNTVNRIIQFLGENKQFTLPQFSFIVRAVEHRISLPEWFHVTVKGKIFPPFCTVGHQASFSFYIAKKSYGNNEWRIAHGHVSFQFEEDKAITLVFKSDNSIKPRSDVDAERLKVLHS